MKNYFRQIFKEHKQGIYGTILFHLILIVALLSMKLHNIQQIMELELEYQEADTKQVIEQIQEEQRREELRQKSADAEVEEMLRSMVSNENADRNNQRTEQSNAIERYIEEAISEINGHQGSDLYKAQRDKNFSQDSLQHLSDQLESELDSLKSTFYQAGSSVSYKLGKRYARKLPIPVFKCENGGKVVVDIEVNRNGRVIKATANSESDPDEQLRETAVDAALRSIFNAKSDAPEIERGTITYNFVKQ